MKPSLVAVFLVMIMAPLAAVAWLAVKVAGDEQEMLSHRFEGLLAERLSDLSSTISKTVGKQQERLEKIADGMEIDTSLLRAAIREERLVKHIFVLDEGGKLIHPPLDQPKNESEMEFLQRTHHIWESHESFFKPSDSASTDKGYYGWYTWYWGGGTNFIYWHRDNAGRIIGIEVDRLTLLADIVADLPATDPDDHSGKDYSIHLLDTRGGSVYIWGSFEPKSNAEPSATLSLSPPLGSWRLHYYPSPEAVGQTVQQNIVLVIYLSFGALALVVAALAIYFFKESGRETREAKQRVTFVNQVSHELKTPLTNIRMYAELLEEQIAEEDEKSKNYLNVIVSESQRLSRLIGNVLSFARKQRQKLTVRQSPGYLPDSIMAVVDQFRPSLESAGFEIWTNLEQEKRKSCFDPDALGQIISNLLGNVEKYAAEGKWLGVESRRRDDLVEILVSDKGPGVPLSAQRKIFEPFVRLSTKLNEGASGTGIGLPIARDLARLQGGDLELTSSEKGAVFRLTIKAPLEEGETSK